MGAERTDPGGLTGVERIGVACLAGLSAALILTQLGNVYLWQDEAQTAVVADTIRSHGIPLGSDGRNFFSQELGKEYGEGYVWKWHTWLSFYTAAASFALLGKTTFAARLPFALFGIAAVVLTYFAGRRLWRSRTAAGASALMLALSVPFLILSRQCRYYTMAAFFTLWGIHAYAGMRESGWRPRLALGVAATLTFHTHYVYCATLLAALLVHALLFDRGRLRDTTLVSAAVALLNLPWIAWFSSIRPGGDAYLASVLDGGKALEFSAGYAALIGEHLFDLRLLAILPAVASWDLLRRKVRPRASAETLDGAALLVVYCVVSVVLISLLSPLLFYRYLAPLAPPLALLSGLLVGTLANRSRVAGVAVLALWLLPSQLGVHLDSLRRDFDGPIEGIVEFLREHADPGDVVAISYGDLPLKFYTDLRVMGGLTGEDLSGVEDADWVIIRRHTNTHADRAIQERLRAMILAAPERYIRHRLAAPDTAFENREDPRLHRFRTADPSLPRVVIYERRP